MIEQNWHGLFKLLSRAQMRISNRQIVILFGLSIHCAEKAALISTFPHQPKMEGNSEDQQAQCFIEKGV